MPVYEFKAVTDKGKMVSSKLNIEGNEATARNRIIEMGLKPLSVKKKLIDAETILEKLKFAKPKNKKGAMFLNFNHSIPIKEHSAIANKYTIIVKQAPEKT